MGKLEVGDKVRIPKYNAYGVITDIDHNWIFPYEVRIEIINDVRVDNHEIDELYDERDLHLVINPKKERGVELVGELAVMPTPTIQDEIKRLIERIENEIEPIKTSYSDSSYSNYSIIKLTEAKMWLDEHYRVLENRKGK